MESHQLIALVLTGVAIVDMVVAFVIVLPRVPEDRRTILQLAFASSTMLLFGLAIASWFKFLDFSS